VDQDAKIYNPIDVEWAIATRFQTGWDAVIVERALGNKLDPSCEDGLSDKMGIDSTVTLAVDPFRLVRIRIPGEDAIDLRKYLDWGTW